MKNALTVIGVLLFLYWSWQMSKGRSRGTMFDGPARYILPLVAIALVGLGILI